LFSKIENRRRRRRKKPEAVFCKEKKQRRGLVKERQKTAASGSRIVNEMGKKMKWKFTT
jgi:hypothetical protein